jgi:hypothetical protein
MRFAPRFACTLFVLVTLPLVATAGPIQWGYRAEAADGTVLRDVTGITDAFLSDYFLMNPRQFGTKQPDPIPDNNVVTDIWRYQATVIVTDELSGDTGSLPIYVDYREQFEVKPDGSLYPIYEGETGGPFWPEPARLELGGNVYRMSTPGGEMLMRVEAGPGPVQTPEPGTLALAGFGIGAALVRRPPVTA